MHFVRALEHRVWVALRVALSPNVLIGMSAAFGLFAVSGVVHLLLGPFASAAAAVGVIACVPPDQPAPRRRKLRQLREYPSLFAGAPGLRRNSEDIVH